MKKWIVSLLVVSGLFVTSYDVEAAQTSGWNFVSNQWRYTDTDGSYFKGWYCISNKWYYFDSSGVMKTGWQKVNGIWYYLNSSGVMQTGWQKVNGSWYFLSSNGAMKTGWFDYAGKKYYLQSSGAMATNTTIGEYKIDSYGVATKTYKNGWQRINNQWFYYTNGKKVTGWKAVNNVWYYFDSSGVMKTGWQKVNGVWYYLNSSGAMQTGWQKVSGTWYYLSSNGAMKTGWFDYAGKKYYLQSSGAMATNTTVGEYKIDAYGVATKQESPEKKLAKEYFALVNKEREKLGVHKLIWSDEIYEAAKIRAKELNEKFDNERPDGTYFNTVADEIGIKNLLLTAQVTNMGSRDPEIIFWMQNKSPLHYDIMKGSLYDYAAPAINGTAMAMIFAVRYPID